MTTPTIAAPPGPEAPWFGLPLLREVQSDLLGFSQRQAQRYGDAVRFQIANIPVFQLSAPEHHMRVLVEKNRSFRKPERLSRVLGQWNGNGLVVNEGESWVRQRRLVNPSFKPDRLATYVDTVVANTDRMLSTWRAGQTVDVTRDLGELTLRTVAQALFGSEISAHVPAFQAAVSVLNELGAKEASQPFVLPLWAPTPAKRRLKAAIDTVDGIVHQMIAAHRQGPDRGDLLSMMLTSVDEEGDKAAMNDRQARDEAVNLMLAGFETTATALVWVLHLLSVHPEHQRRVRGEVSAVLGSGPPTFAQLKQLTVTESVVKEALRLYPPAYVLPRQAKEDVEVGGFTLPAGSLVNLLVYLTQRDPRWFAQPEAFLPERFEHEDSWPKGAYLPFGLGPRACIGRAFAMMELVSSTAMLVRRFHFAPSGKAVEEEAQVSLHPKGGLSLKLESVS